jgi:hypothetical protein
MSATTTIVLGLAPRLFFNLCRGREKKETDYGELFELATREESSGFGFRALNR